MRNWNGYTWKRISKFRRCFQTTYEELKPSNSYFISFKSSLPDYLWGIETGHIAFSAARTSARLPDYLWGIETVQHSRVSEVQADSFQTTYEELKQAVCLSFPYTIVLGLPDYLWGIETSREGRGIGRPGTRLPDYLWGIETSWFNGRIGR